MAKDGIRYPSAIIHRTVEDAAEALENDRGWGAEAFVATVTWEEPGNIQPWERPIRNAGPA